MGHAVGLGEISTYSALNQPLNAQIEMVSTSPDEVGGITVKLAPESVFEQVGITRSPVLNHLRFKPAVVNGTPVIKVSSDRPIQEPFVNFIVEVSWPKGKLLREYTVLLDPPVLGGGAPAPATTEAPADIAEVPIFVSEPEGGEAAEAAPLATAPVETAEPVATTEVTDEEGLPPFVGEAPADLETFTVTETPEAVVEEAEVVEEPELLPLEETETVTTAPVADLEDTENWLPPFVGGAFDSTSADIDTYAVDEGEPVVAEEGVETAPTGDTYQVARGDTLFSIARRARQGTAANIHQMMVAIQRSNPSAFIRNDMNRLKAGYILRMPDPAEAASISRAEAKAAVMAAIAAQGGAFQQFKSKAAKTAVPQTPAPATPEPVAGSAAGIADLESRVKEGGPTVVAGGEVAEKPNLEILTPEGKGDSAAGGAVTLALGRQDFEIGLFGHLATGNDRGPALLDARFEIGDSRGAPCNGFGSGRRGGLRHGRLRCLGLELLECAALRSDGGHHGGLRFGTADARCLGRIGHPQNISRLQAVHVVANEGRRIAALDRDHHLMNVRRRPLSRPAGNAEERIAARNLIGIAGRSRLDTLFRDHGLAFIDGVGIDIRAGGIESAANERRQPVFRILQIGDRRGRDRFGLFERQQLRLFDDLGLLDDSLGRLGDGKRLQIGRSFADERRQSFFVCDLGGRDRLSRFDGRGGQRRCLRRFAAFRLGNEDRHLGDVGRSFRRGRRRSAATEYRRIEQHGVFAQQLALRPGNLDDEVDERLLNRAIGRNLDNGRAVDDGRLESEVVENRTAGNADLFEDRLRRQLDGDAAHLVRRGRNHFDLRIQRLVERGIGGDFSKSHRVTHRRGQYCR